jgi:hypothetical protein
MSKPKAASVEVVSASSFEVIVGGGGGGLETIVQTKRFTLLRRPFARFARRRNTWVPRRSPEYDLGFAHGLQRLASRRHSAFDERGSSHANVAFLEIDGKTGAVLMSGRRKPCA